jgi:hypothetical protein
MGLSISREYPTERQEANSKEGTISGALNFL